MDFQTVKASLFFNNNSDNVLNASYVPNNLTHYISFSESFFPLLCMCLMVSFFKLHNQKEHKTTILIQWTLLVKLEGRNNFYF